MAGRKPIFGFRERIDAHSLEMTDILTKVMEAATTPSRYAPYQELFSNTDYGTFLADKNDRTHIRLICDLNRQTNHDYQKGITLSRGSGWSEIHREALDLLDKRDTLETAISDANQHMARSLLAELGWYLEQRQWVLNAQAHPRSINHWVRATPSTMRLLLGLLKAKKAITGPAVQIKYLPAAMPQSTPDEMATEISRMASEEGKSLKQFLDGLDLPDMLGKDGSKLRGEARCLRDRLSINLSGELTAGVEYLQDEQVILIKNRYSQSALEGLITTAPGKPLRKVIDLPWHDETDIIFSMDTYEDQIVLRLSDHDLEPQNIMQIEQMLPRAARPPRKPKS